MILNNYHVPDEHLEWLEEECAITARLIAIGEIKVNDTNLLTQARINANLLGKAKAEGWPKKRRVKHDGKGSDAEVGPDPDAIKAGFRWDDKLKCYVGQRTPGSAV